MEETKFHRKLSPRSKAENYSSLAPITESRQTDIKAIEENSPETEATDTKGRIFDNGRSTPYWRRLKVFDRKVLRYPSHLKGMFLRPLIFLGFPVIFYSGFSYGSNLIWFNVLNGTASLILSEAPYGFSSSIVGLCYISPLIGVILG